MIKVFLSDLDGTLTNGGYYVSGKDNCAVVKSFHTRDFYGFRLLHEKGIKIGIITAAGSKCDSNQISRAAPFAALFHNIQDKYHLVRETYVRELHIPWDDIAYIGDDLNDLELLRAVGYAACPADADERIISYLESRPVNGWITRRVGGQGCVREFINIFYDL